MRSLSFKRPSPALVISCVALFVALSASAVAIRGSNKVTSGDIKPGAVKRSDLAANAVDSRRVANFKLNDEDISRGTFVHFEADVGEVPAHDCVARQITGINATKDHLLLTPNWNTTFTDIVYTVSYVDTQEHAYLNACNITDTALDEGTARFSLLVIDAQ